MMKRERLSARLAEITTMDRDCCRTEWQNLFKEMPDRYLSTRVMRRALSYEAQAKAGQVVVTGQTVFRPY